MAGWNHATTQCACWQLTANSPDDLREWATKTLAYSRIQLEHYPPSILAP
jgi:hypothetical protein